MSKTVLLVEDHGLVRAGIRAMLNIVAPASVVLEAGTFDAAIAVLDTRQVDIVFLDIDLRSADSGLDLLRYVRDRAPGTRIVMLSATDDAATVVDCLANGASGYIAKGHGDESVFSKALETVFADRVFLPESVKGYKPPEGRAASRNDPSLSPRLNEVLYYLCQGMPNKAIARCMGIGEATVRKNYVSDLLRLFNVSRRTELIIEVSRRGMRVQRPASAPMEEAGEVRR